MPVPVEAAVFKLEARQSLLLCLGARWISAAKSWDWKGRPAMVTEVRTVPFLCLYGQGRPGRRFLRSRPLCLLLVFMHLVDFFFASFQEGYFSFFNNYLQILIKWNLQPQE